MRIDKLTGICSVQDLGRIGHRSQGIRRNGAMDAWSLMAGNALLKNPTNTPAIELTMAVVTLSFDCQVSFCLTGAQYEAYLDGEQIRNYWRVQAHAGQTLELKRAVTGLHGYLCIQGGLNMQSVLGSASTDIQAGFGGYQGRLLQAGDDFELTDQFELATIGIASLPAQDTIRISKNSEYDAFTANAHQQLESQAYKLLPSSSRMGYRLEGNHSLTLKSELQMPSHGVDVGMIQVPPNGQPIVLMADAQTTGGYPKIASVIEADLGLLAQTRFGQTCRFAVVSLGDAIIARNQRLLYIDRIRRYANAN
ncbi:allophanate hydrolase [Moraxella lincolnii]|uniref:Allophanate hydrolase n=1 Tax=Lwoffella lincolnii TaxID=90241 RepID=A0A1T0CDC4_9GAMM|nr:biotin-dependent carboxyltransferase family protein [Moraxella lincolnii]OOS20336.1 allophanate hydrolase [Moraxella lincolnii]